jgi:hypothetical protein
LPRARARAEARLKAEAEAVAANISGAGDAGGSPDVNNLLTPILANVGCSPIRRTTSRAMLDDIAHPPSAGATSSSAC